MNALDAKIGTLEAVKKASKDNHEPAYIKALMDAISEYLYAFARKENLETSKKKRAWLLTMSSILSATFGAARAWNQLCDAASTANYNVARYSAYSLAAKAANLATTRVGCDDETAVRSVAYRAALNSVRNAAHNAAYSTTMESLQNDRQISPEETGRRAYRVGEWSVLNYLLENVGSIVKPNYDAALSIVLVDVQDDPFESWETLIIFYNDHFASLTYDTMIFLVPWLVHIFSIDVVSPKHQPLFVHHYVLLNWPLARLLILAESDEDRKLCLPTDLLRFILNILIQIPVSGYNKAVISEAP